VASALNPPTYNVPPIPTPPRTCNAPVVVDVAEVTLVTVVNPDNTLVPVTPSVPLNVPDVAFNTP
jgi:hypothetical protein